LHLVWGKLMGSE